MFVLLNQSAMNTITEKEIITVYKNLGFTEDVTSCDCCGRVDLKGTYAIENTLTGEIGYLGCVCAASRMNWSKKEFITKYKAEEREQAINARKEYHESAEYIEYNEWLASLNIRFLGFEDDEHAQRMNAVKTERPVHYNALEVCKKYLFIKYPLCKHIY